MLSFALTPVETRILGCLLEKERVTPENYPLSLHSLTAACNQATNREPVTSFDEKEVELGANLLREKKLASVVFGAGSRVQKYRHRLLEHFTLEPKEVALLCVLLLRGPQTPGELRTRSERMYGFPGLPEIEACLAEMGHGDSPLVRVLPPRPGQKERRWQQLFSAESDTVEASSSTPVVSAASPSQSSDLPVAPPSPGPDVERQIAELRAELEALRAEFAKFRRQFE